MSSKHWSELMMEAGEARRLGQYEKAEKLYMAALAQALPFAEAEAKRVYTTQVTTLLNAIADFYRERGMLEIAIKFAREGLQLGRRIFPTGHGLIGNDLMFLAMLLDQQGQYEEALKLADEGVAVYEKELGPSNPHVDVQRWIRDSIKLHFPS